MAGLVAVIYGVVVTALLSLHSSTSSASSAISSFRSRSIQGRLDRFSRARSSIRC
jgi:hypothetical protein